MPKHNKLGKKARRILDYLNRIGPINSTGTRYYAHDWKALERLRELGYLEPGRSCATGSGVTDAGREYLKNHD